MDKNKELHELFGLCWHETYTWNEETAVVPCCSKCGIAMSKSCNPNYATDPTLVLVEMKKLKLWLGFLGHLDDIGYYDKLTNLPELFMDPTGKLRDLAIEYLRSK